MFLTTLDLQNGDTAIVQVPPPSDTNQNDMIALRNMAATEQMSGHIEILLTNQMANEQQIEH